MKEINNDIIQYNNSSTKRMINVWCYRWYYSWTSNGSLSNFFCFISWHPADTIPTALGLAFGADINSAMMTGFGLHMLTSVLIGIIFGVVVANVSKLRISGFTKGVSEGLITGMIAFAILLIPISMSVMPPVMMELVMQMNPTMNQQQIRGMLQQNMPTMILVGVLEHLVYGAVLGVITTALIIKVK